MSPSKWRVGRPAVMIMVIVGTLLVALVLVVGVATTRPKVPPASVAVEFGPRVQRLLSYTPQTVESDLPVEEEFLTGDYRDEYVELVSATLAPQSRSDNVSVEATVRENAVVDATPEAMVLLMVADIVTSRAGIPGDTSVNRFRVTLQAVQDKWLISGIDVI